MTAEAERVLVLPREIALPAPWHGLRADPAAVAGLAAAIREHGRFVLRAAAEEDRNAKQVIPYLLLRDGRRWFLMRRTRAGVDARLHDHWSVGVGGHVNPGDVDLAGGLRREWREELVADFVPAFRPLGLLNDDETAVGSVHIGVVHVADAAGRSVAIREVDKLEGGFVDPDEVIAVRAGLESWSRILVDALLGDGVRERL